MPARAEGKPKTLTAAFVKTISKPGRYGDGHGSFGLFLRVWPMVNGRTGKNWAQRLHINGKYTHLGLGPAALLSLAEAREKAKQNARAILEGVDPRKSPWKMRRVIQTSVSPAFGEAVDRVIDVHNGGWKHPKTAKSFQATLEQYAFPSLQTKPVSEVTSHDVMAILEPIWTSKPETSRKVRKGIGKVMKWAMAQGYRSDNPAGDIITQALPKHGRSQHFQALPFSEIGVAIEKVRKTEAWPATKLCFEFIALTAARSGEARQAAWDEIDLETATWTVPATKMKNGRAHRVPLSKQAMNVLAEARTLSDGTGPVFPSQRGKGMSDTTISKLLREHEIGTVPHGLRSSFRDWAAECSDVPREIAEHALAHVEGSAAELAYRRTDYFERRRALMQEWADFLDCSAPVGV